MCEVRLGGDPPFVVLQHKHCEDLKRLFPHSENVFEEVNSD